ncbi:unnamed protein product [Polarella glacialis]|uniref:Uncharacterized protein n=1 Tax=Polarella glacialis TaxID=89957 RepID=A0A813FVJ0_POLGL|nr:unnamed protein product [Polarella glacialis]CAE8618034.1 unnamed protein product [Polarella glacialis]
MGCSSSIERRDQRCMRQVAVCPMDAHEEASSSRHASSGSGSSKISSGFEVQVAWQEDDVQNMGSFQFPPKASIGEVDLWDADKPQAPVIQPRANSGVPCGSNDELDEFNNMKIVSEPVDLKSYNSLDFDPKEEFLNRKRAVAPCAPSQRRYFKSLEKSLHVFQKNPGLLELSAVGGSSMSVPPTKSSWWISEHVD